MENKTNKEQKYDPIELPVEILKDILLYASNLDENEQDKLRKAETNDEIKKVALEVFKKRISNNGQ